MLLLVPVILIASVWACGALYYDGPSPWFGAALALVMLAGWVVVRPWYGKPAFVGFCSALVLGWWLTLKPAQQGDWQPDVARLAWADVHGDEVTLHNVRNCDYRSENDYTPRWDTRTVRLSQLTGFDLAINYWGSPWMAHPILSFQFSGAAPICFSIETRKKRGQSYDAIAGLYRQFELIYVVADERDVIRVRTNYRHGEEVYLYHATATPGQARARFLEYLCSLNDLRDHPRWYNALATNCTTAIRAQHPTAERLPWDWRILLNGKGDELMYERRAIASGTLPFADLKRRSLINPVARAANQASDFSARIRQGLPSAR